jgi:hypothetical protein
MTQDEMIERINAWQKNGAVHQLTCGTDSWHPPLVPEAEGDTVVLRCPTCGYRQTFIPAIVLGARA